MQRDSSIRQWIFLALLVVVVSLLGLSLRAEAHDTWQFSRETFQIMELNEAMDSPDEALGAVRLNRTRDELWASFHVHGLDPNTAFTIWGVIFNNPEGCETNPEGDIRCSGADLMPVPNPARASAFNVGAFVTGSDGTANISVHIRSGLPPDGAFVLFGKGAVNPANDNGVRPGLRRGNGFGAEVHLVIRTHGEILEDAIAAQLSMFNGGCEPPNTNTCTNVQVATFPSVKD